MQMNVPEEFTPSRVLATSLGALIVLAGLFLVSRTNYLLFHSIAEIFSIVVAFGIFMVGWNARRFLRNRYFLFLGIAYAFVGFLDLVHTLAYKGMNVIEGTGSNLPTELWIAARAMEAVSLFLATFFVRRNLPLGPLILGFALTTALLLAAIFAWDVFPDCYVEGEGLTPFKIACEYAVSGLLIVSGVLLFRRREDFDRTLLELLLGSILATLLAELSFTLFRDVYGHLNFLGHYLKIVSFFLIYRAVVQIGLRMPYRLLYADLQDSQKSLQSAHSQLEHRVQRRTAELEATNEILRREIGKREQAQEDLRESQALYATLVEASLSGVYMQQDGRILFANERFADIFGYPRQEMVGMEASRLVHPDDRPRIREIHRLRLKGEAVPSEYEVRGMTRDGRVIWVNRRIRLIHHKGRPAVLGNVVDISRRKQMEHELHGLSSRILSAEEQERKRIARELHDGLGQLLGAVKFRIESVVLRLDADTEGHLRHPLDEVIGLIRRTIEEMRRILADLRPSILDDLGIVPTIQWVCREFQQTHGDMAVEKHVEVDEQTVPEALKTVIYRVIQEGLNNVAKHSRATTVRVSLAASDGDLLLQVEDDGVGFDEQGGLESVGANTGIGLHSMRERSRFSGGRFSLTTSEGQGTRISVAWPLNPASEDGG